MRAMTPKTMTPSYSAPKLPRPSYGGVEFNPHVSLDEENQIMEQREVNSGVRATFSAVNSTLRSQGAAVRGLEELLKRALPEIDRLAAIQKTKADISTMEGLIQDFASLRSILDQSEERSRGTLAMVDGKFDAALGQRTLDALARQQQQAEHEAAAREAVAAEVVRLTSTVAVFSTNVDQVRNDHRTMEPRIVSLERRAEMADIAMGDQKAQTEKLDRDKASLSEVDSLREVADGATRAHSKLEAETRRQHGELSKSVAAKIEQVDCQRALDALAEQLSRQANENAQADTRISDSMAARLDRSEAAARTALMTVEGDASEARADLQAQVERLQLAVDTAAANAASQVREKGASPLHSSGPLVQLLLSSPHLSSPILTYPHLFPPLSPRSSKRTPPRRSARLRRCASSPRARARPSRAWPRCACRWAAPPPS